MRMAAATVMAAIATTATTAVTATAEAGVLLAGGTAARICERPFLLRSVSAAPRVLRPGGCAAADGGSGGGDEVDGSDGDGEGWRAPSGVAGPGGGVEKGTLFVTRPLLPGSGYPMGARRPAAAPESAAMARATTPTAGNAGGWPAAVTA